MDQELQLPDPKISEVEIILIGAFYILIDLIDLIPIAGDVTDIVVAPMGFYYWMKGINGVSFIVSEIIELIPGLQEIPSRTLAWIFTVWLDRHPKIEAKLATVIAAANMLEGDVAESEAQTAGQLPGNTTDLPQTAEGVYGYQAEGVATGEAGVAGAESPGSSSESSEPKNTKPSEKTTERDRETGEDKSSATGKAEATDETGESSENVEPPQTEEERKEESSEARYKELTEAPSEKNPIENIRKEYFEDHDVSQRKSRPNVESTDAGRVRVAANQEKNASQGKTAAQRQLEERNAKRAAVREQLLKPKQPKVITPEDDQKEAGDADDFADAA